GASRADLVGWDSRLVRNLDRGIPGGRVTARGATWRPVGALVIAAIWAVSAALPIGGYLGGPATFVDSVSIWWYSVALGSLAIVAAIIASLVPGSRFVAGLAVLLAAGGIAGAIGNALEDAVHVANAEYLYGIGFLAALAAMLGLTLATAVRRCWPAAGLGGATLAGIVVMAGHGPPLVPVLWLGVGAAGLLGRREALSERA
ncbi:MAG TPA: hypothetical protein VNH13_08585, partial [Candidatus Acidoferrales bacterium]|nr:hypothetical protein [Candidatus Acidoferrales bacterium]